MSQTFNHKNLPDEILSKLEAISPSSWEAVIVSRLGMWPIMTDGHGTLVAPCKNVSLVRRLVDGEWVAEWCVHVNDLWFVVREFHGLGATFNIFIDHDGYKHIEFEVPCNV